MASAFNQQLLQSQMEVQEATLLALSKELHDNIGQLLSTTKMLIGITERSIAQPPDTLKTANETLGKAIAELRSLSKSMDKEWLEQFNLLENLQAEVNRINIADSVKLHFNHPDTIFLKPDEQVILFRIIQEAVQNALKHAEAKNIFVSIETNNDILCVQIKDDGRGFSEKKLNTGLGLKNLKQRTKILGGKIHWSSAPDKGCTVSIDLPVKTNAK